MNQIFHEAAQKAWHYGDYPENTNVFVILTEKEKEDLLCKLVIEKITELVYLIKPREFLVLQVDSLVPMAKIQQQRERRYRSALTPNGVFDTSRISPGTPLMEKIDEKMREWLKTLVESNEHFPENVIYGSYKIKGEGEHKIFSFLRKNPNTKDTTDVVYGLDADLILLSMLFNNIILCRYSKSETIFVDIDYIKKCVYQDMGRSETYVMDFILIMNFVGNDFLQQIPTLRCIKHDIQFLTDIYKTLGLSLTVKNDINIQNLISFVKVLADSTPELIENLKRNPQTLHIDLLKDPSDPPELSFSQRLYKDMGIHTEDAKKDVCTNYIFGLQWVLDYYTEDPGVKWGWYYKYLHSPMPHDIVSVLSESLTGNITDTLYYEDVSYNIYHQLLMIIPPVSFDVCLPPKLIKKLPDVLDTKKFPVKYDLDVKNSELNMEGVPRQEKTHPLIQKADLHFIQELYTYKNPAGTKDEEVHIQLIKKCKILKNDKTKIDTQYGKYPSASFPVSGSICPPFDDFPSDFVYPYLEFYNSRSNPKMEQEACQGRGRFQTDQGRGRSSEFQGRGRFPTDQGRGRFQTDQGRGRSSEFQGRGRGRIPQNNFIRKDEDPCHIDVTD